MGGMIPTRDDYPFEVPQKRLRHQGFSGTREDAIIGLMTSEADRMCQRDGQGRFRAGASGNPAGRPKVSAMARLLAAAEAVGARIVVELPSPKPAAVEPVGERPA